MKVTLPIDPFTITQVFGVNPSAYAQYGLKGHNGWDVRTKLSDSPDGKRNILSPQDARFHQIGNEGAKGYGKFVEIITETAGRRFKHTFAHCASTPAFTVKRQGEGVAISDNTGNSTAAHLHWTVKELNADNSVKNYQNGYFGAINPQIYLEFVRSVPEEPQPPMNDKEATMRLRAKVAADKILIDLRDRKLKDKNGNIYVTDPASEIYLYDPNDQEKFTGLLKVIVRDYAEGQSGNAEVVALRAELASLKASTDQLLKDKDIACVQRINSLRQEVVNLLNTL